MTFDNNINKKIYNTKSLTIGFFTQASTGAGGFHDAVWLSMVKASKLYNINLFIFSGGAIENSPYNPYEKNANIIYDLANKNYIDGLVINCIIGNFISKDSFNQFCNKYSPIPVVSIIGPIKGFPDVHVNNKIGMENIILHLINNHGHKKLAFIRGALGNPDAEERFNIYKEVLTKNNIKYDPDLIKK
jgi:DNA-binding LacI/PurR family transcriptional regulator